MKTQREGFIAALADALIEANCVVNRGEADRLIAVVIEEGWRWRGYGLDLAEARIEQDRLYAAIREAKRLHVVPLEGRVEMETSVWKRICDLIPSATEASLKATHADRSEDA